MPVIPPIDSRDDAYFWEGVRKGALVSRECANCGRIQHPPTPMCPACGSVAWTERQLSGRGTVNAWIVSRHPNRPDDPPRIVVLVDLEEGVRLVSNLIGAGTDEITNGMAVIVTFEDVEDVLLPQFRPAERISA